MFHKKLKQEIEFLKLQIESIQKVEKHHWNYIQAMTQGMQQDRKDLNTVIAKINQMKKTETKTKGKK